MEFICSIYNIDKYNFSGKLVAGKTNTGTLCVCVCECVCACVCICCVCKINIYIISFLHVESRTDLECKAFFFLNHQVIRSNVVLNK